MSRIGRLELSPAGLRSNSIYVVDVSSLDSLLLDRLAARMSIDNVYCVNWLGLPAWPRITMAPRACHVKVQTIEDDQHGHIGL
jgi:hypothetical protein